jgi:hypothetical protein
MNELSIASVEALLKRTKSRRLQYLCRGYLRFGEGVMVGRDLDALRKAIAKVTR